MVSPFCWGCLTPLRQTSRTILPSPSTAVSRGPAFHTSAALQFMGRASQGGKKGSTVLKFRQPASSTMKKKKKFVEKARPPPVGERKAIRKRIVLSNPNALEVEGLQELSEETMVDSRLRGTVLALPVPMLDQLRAVQAFKPKQGWSIFRRPCTVLRRETLELGRFFDGVTGDTEGGGAVIKKIVGGARKSGKSVHLLQAMAMGFIKKWVVFTIPEAQELVSATSSYAPLSEENPNLYVQNEATAALLSRTVAANKEVLSGLRVSHNHPTVPAAKPGMTLEDLAKTGVQDQASAWAVFQALWTELTATGPAPGLEKHYTPRPPILVTVDGLGHWMTESQYRNAQFKLIHAHDLVFVRHFLSLLKPGQDKPTLPNGGALLYATSTTNNPPYVYSLDVALKQVAARGAGVESSSPQFPQPEPYSKTDPRVFEVLESMKSKHAQEGMLQHQILGGVTHDEARGFMEYFARSGLLQETISDEWVSEKWTLAGGGVIGELERIGKRLRIAA
ncbi:mitochondrial ribosomal death-associated protein 3-domain-containing protein [Aspergillus pseudodeflectus]|uniref:Small ribosomal subunit protein mS29 n=1 Tax=Aspergillus pseudodeflectus TaxID=176178 RepID=A0ABR4L2J3_9EURO